MNRIDGQAVGCGKRTLLRSWVVLSSLVACLCVTGAAQEVRPLTGPTAAGVGERLPYVDPTTLDPRVPAPESMIGHAVGERAVRYDAMLRYLQALADGSPYVTLTHYAQSFEGRSLFYLTITSEIHHRRLDEIRAANARLADPRKLANPAEAERIIDSLPGIAWMAYSIHGDELSSTDAAVQLAYQLAAGTDANTRRLRDELVIHIDPLMNPDGRERYLGQLQHLAGKVTSLDSQAMQHVGLWSAGRGNHYLFDLNRDWLWQVHPETRGRAAEILSWNPHLVVDSHEMWAMDTYLFDPPREPFNVNLADYSLRWRRAFSAEQAAALDRFGWSYYTQEWYEEWYPGYTNAWASLLGAVGILYEQARVNSAAVRQASGRVLSYHEAVHHQLVSSFANLESLRKHRKAFLGDFFRDREWAVSPGVSPLEWFLVRPMNDADRFQRFMDLLTRQGIAFGIAQEGFDARQVLFPDGSREESVRFPAGSLVVQAAQPHRRLLKAMLEFDPHMSDGFLHEERKELERGRGSKVYDITAWNLPMAYGLDAGWAAGLEGAELAAAGESAVAFPERRPSYGYLIDNRHGGVYTVLARLLEKDFKIRVAGKPFAIGDKAFAAGAILLRGHENGDALHETLRAAAGEAGVSVAAIDTALSQSGPDLGGNDFHLLQPPRIAIASQWPIDSTSFGSTWFLLDARLRLRTSPVHVQYLPVIDLRKYNVLILPDTWNREGLEAVLNEGMRARLKHWIEAGGTLVAMGGSAALLAKEELGLSSVRLKRNVLDKLDVYAEALAREKSAREVSVNPAEVWGRGSAGERTADAEVNAKGAEEKEDGPAESDPEKRKRLDAWQRTFSPQGAITAAVIDPEHWLCFGVQPTREHLPLLIQGSFAFMSMPPVQTAVRLGPKDELRWSGLLWPEARERWGDTAYATVERVGHGQVILFLTDPFFRAGFEGTGRMLLNALLLGPGMGTSQPAPW